MAARSLLALVLGRLPAESPRLLQFLSLDSAPAFDVTRAFCVAAAERLGRVLHAELLSDSVPAVPQGIVPDTVVARLYHGRLSVCPLDVVRRGPSALLSAVDATSKDFEAVVVESCHTEPNGDDSNVASAFSGTILVVRSGVTTLYQMRTGARAVQRAGGVVLGAVLLDVPSRPSWLQWFGAR